MSQPNLPKIIKTIFILDKDRRYSFDVNQNVSIRSIKKMITAAANLDKTQLRIFHEGVEYTKKDEDTLDFLFPSLDIIIFDLSISASSPDNYDELISVKLNEEYCPLHFSKYPYFYCYDCKKSICSQCVFSDAHKGHDYIEKYDYLQSGKNLVSKLFKDLKDIQFDDDRFILEFKDKIRIKFISKLKQMIDVIEKNLIEVVEEFLKKNKQNIEIIQNNMSSLKVYCGRGLDELKDQICIEDMMLDEEIFLIFDKKFKDIKLEKERVNKDLEKYNNFKQQLKKLTESVEKIYNEIYAFLDKYITNDMYVKIVKEFDKDDIVPLKEKDVIYSILSNIKKKPKLYTSIKKSKSKLFPDSSNNKENKDNMQVENVTEINQKEEPLNLKSVPKKSGDNLQSQILDAKFICLPVEKTNNILVYDVINQKAITKKIGSLFVNEIPYACAWVNYKNYLYISGGELNGKINKNFYRYDPEKNEFLLLPQIPDNKEYHSMTFDDNDNLYLVGGLTNTILKYNIQKQNWTVFKNKLTCQRNHPICVVKDNDLYVFFGSDIYGGYISSYEKTNIDGKNKIVMFNPEQKINLELASTIETVENSILFFGGKNENGVVKTCWKFNADKQKFEMAPYTLSEPSSFHQCSLSQIGENCFGYFSNESMDFVKLNFNYNN